MTTAADPLDGHAPLDARADADQQTTSRPQAGAGLEGQPRRAGRWEWISSAASVVAPLSVISTLLFYFGYASARAQYEYFGLDVDTIGLSTQDYVMRSPQPLLTPLLGLALLGVAVAVAHSAIRGRVDAAVAGAARDTDAGSALRCRQRLASIRRATQAAVLAGLTGLAGGIVMLVGYSRLRGWGFYPLATPLLFALAATLILYGLWVRGLLAPRQRPRRGVAVSISLVLAASLFWATATLAQWSGRGLARYTATHLDELPSLILDTRERLYLPSPGIEETMLQPSSGQTFHYRYRNLRLLILGQNRLFLVPPTWSASDLTLVVPLDDGSVRLQFQFQNEPP
jgi:hypothetical protein